MIEIVKPIDDFRSCNVCCTRNDVMEIKFRWEYSAIVVALCKDCRKELAKKLKEGEPG